MAEGSSEPSKGNALVDVEIAGESYGALRVPQAALTAAVDDPSYSISRDGETITIELAGGLSIHLCPSGE